MLVGPCGTVQALFPNITADLKRASGWYCPMGSSLWGAAGISSVLRPGVGLQTQLLLLLPTSLRLATSDAPDAMEEWDVPQMKKEVESLKYQLAFKREMSSKTIPE